MTLVCSWSGGKDSALALHRAGGRPDVLLTMLTEHGRRSRSHGLPLSVLRAQAEALGARLEARATSWAGYERTFTDALRELRPDAVVFGDIDLEAHREWNERVCREAETRALLPLWGRARRELLEELLALGYEATIVAVRDGVLPRSLLGRRLDAGLIGELAEAGVDLSGELGEYHTVVTDGALFAAPLRLEPCDDILRDGYWFLDVATSRPRSGRARPLRASRAPGRR